MSQILPREINCQKCEAEKYCLKNWKEYGPNGDITWKEWVDYCEKLREEEAQRIVEKHGKIKLYILVESIPLKRFIYDRNSDYRKGRYGLRKNLCKELLGGCPDDVKSCKNCQNFDVLMEYLRNKGILVVDCALCPLHIICQTENRVKAAINCLKNNNIYYLERFKDSPIIAIFPSKVIKKSLFEDLKNLQEIGGRILKVFQFSSLQGLENMIEQVLESGR